jgi:hypothetical protein
VGLAGTAVGVEVARRLVGEGREHEPRKRDRERRARGRTRPQDAWQVRSMVRPPIMVAF